MICYNVSCEKKVIGIDKTLDFILIKNNLTTFNKKNVAYLRNIDKILFDVDNIKYSLSINNILFTREKTDSIFKLSQEYASIYLKEESVEFDLKIEYISIENKENEYIINYKLESDEENSTIKIILNN